MFLASAAGANFVNSWAFRGLAVGCLPGAEPQVSAVLAAYGYY